MEYIQISAKTVDDAITEALIQLGVTSEQLEYEVIEKGSAGFLGINSKKAIIKARKKETLEDKVRSFLDEMFRAMNMEVVVNLTYDEDSRNMDIELKGTDMGILIGKRGQTLDAIQYLVSIVANKDTEEYIHVKLDTENYRKRRRETIENLAKNLAYKVKRTKKAVTLEPMNAYERRIIHSALQSDKYVSTYSEGEEPYRHVVIGLKK
ncbi:MAG: protein jag [Lachnospiraceae bacterium]|nr:protein jag [Lachnospiraceae bacterium]